MLWRKKTEVLTDIASLVRVNDQIQLEINGKTYLSRVEDIQEGELHVAVPTECIPTGTIRSDQQVVVNVFGGTGISRFSGVVKDLQINRTTLVTITDLKSLGAIQRREHVRIPVRLPVRFRFDDSRNHMFCWFDGVTRDISGGGMQITGDSQGIGSILRGDLLDLELYLPDQPPIEATGRIVRVPSHDPRLNSTMGFGVQFVRISAGDRSRIVRYVLTKEADMLALRRDFVHCCQLASIEYRCVSEDTDGSYKVANATDMSTSGLRMTVGRDAVAVGRSLLLSIELLGVAIETQGEVVWLEDGKSGSVGMQAGIRFTNVSTKARQCITKFLEDQGNGEASGESRAA